MVETGPTHFQKQFVFVGLGNRTLETLLQRTLVILEEEYLKKFPAPKARANIPDLAHRKLKDFASPLLRRLTHLYDALLEIQEFLNNRLMKDSEVLKRRALLEIARYYNLDENLLQKTVLPQEQQSTRPTGANQIESDAGLRPGSELPSTRKNRRAVDSRRWQDYQSGQPARAIMDWQHAFLKLGPFFTVRIMLRKELFKELNELIQHHQNWNYEEVCRIARDVRTAQGMVRSRGKMSESLKELDHLVDFLQELMRKI